MICVAVVADKPKKKGKPGRPPLIPDNEKEIHRDAFELYYSLGDSMSVRQKVIQVCNEFGKSYGTIFKWKKKFNWDERKRLRDMRVQRRIEDKTENHIVEVRSKYLKLIEISIDDYLRRAEQGDFIRIEKSIDIDRLVKLGLLLRGDVTDRKEKKSDDEIRAELKEKADAYEKYFAELEDGLLEEEEFEVSEERSKEE